MKKYILIFLAFSLFSGSSYAQCNDKLVAMAIDSIGENATYIQNFKAKLKTTEPNESRPMASYSVVLTKGTNYRFSIVNDTTLSGKAILQLYTNNNLVGSTFDFSEGKDYHTFDFFSKKTTNYQIFISFKNGKEGCAAGILSIVNIPKQQIVNSSDIGINGKTSGYITKKEILAKPFLKIIAKKDSFSIKEFSIKFNKNSKILKSNSDKFTDEQIKEIKRLKISETFEIVDIKINNSKESYFLTEGIKFEIIGIQDQNNLILYTNNENKVEINSTLAGNQNLEVSIDKGRIEGDKGNYSIWVQEEGAVNVGVIAKNAKGEIVESDTVLFHAIEMQPISAKAFGKIGGIIRKDQVQYKQYDLELDFPSEISPKGYEVISFYIGEDRAIMKGIKSETGKITNAQNRFIRELKSGEVFYIKDILVKTPLNNIIRLEPLGFIIE